MTLFDRFAVLDIELEEGNAVRIENLRIAFEITKTLTAANNTAQVSVWNLSRETRAAIREKDPFIRLQAGYRQDIIQEVLFTGNASLINSKIDTPDVITEIELSDGLRELKQLRLVLSFSPRTPAKTILEDIAARMQLDVRFIAPIEGSFAGGYAYSGPVRGALEEVTSKLGLSWSIQNNELQIIKRNVGIQEEVYVITPETGMLESPTKLIYTEGALVGDTNTTEPEWSVRCLLNPRLVPGSRVQLDSRQLRGLYLVDNVRHVGDTRGSDFYTEIEVRDVE